MNAGECQRCGSRLGIDSYGDVRCVQCGTEVNDVVEIIDGYIVRCSDGEVIGLAEIDGVFRVTTRDAADLVLRKLGEVEAGILALEVQRKAINARLDKEVKRLEQRASWLRFRFGSELEEFARLELAGGKRKTLNLPHGSLCFRTSKGTTTITDMGEALAFVEVIDPGKIKRTVTVTNALEAYRSWRTDNDPEIPPFMESSGPRETFRIDTGLTTNG